VGSELTPTKWASAYVYCASLDARFLIEYVQPFVLHAFRNSYATQFFFVRYFDNGIHLRIRFKSKSNSQLRRLRILIKAHFNIAIKEVSLTTPSTESASDKYENVVRFVKYRPEIRRYGGKFCISLAENQFELSSQCVIQALRGLRDHSYDNIFGLSLRMQAIFVNAIGMSTEEIITLFKISFTNFKGHLLNKNFESLNNLDEILETNFQQNKKNILASLRPLLPDRITSHKREGWILKWFRGNVKIGIEFKKLARVGRVRTTSRSLTGLRNTHYMKFANSKLWPIYLSLVHMTNNRLGIHNYDEAFQSYLLMRVFQTFKETQY